MNCGKTFSENLLNTLQQSSGIFSDSFMKSKKELASKYTHKVHEIFQSLSSGKLQDAGKVAAEMRQIFRSNGSDYSSEVFVREVFSQFSESHPELKPLSDSIEDMVTAFKRVHEHDYDSYSTETKRKIDTIMGSFYQNGDKLDTIAYDGISDYDETVSQTFTMLLFKNSVANGEVNSYREGYYRTRRLIKSLVNKKGNGSRLEALNNFSLRDHKFDFLSIEDKKRISNSIAMSLIRTALDDKNGSSSEYSNTIRHIADISGDFQYVMNNVVRKIRNESVYFNNSLYEGTRFKEMLAMLE